MQVEVTTGIALTGPVAYMPTCHCGYLLTHTYTVAKMSTYMYSHVLTIAPTVRIITGQAEILTSQNVHRHHQTIPTTTSTLRSTRPTLDRYCPRAQHLS